MVLSEVFTSRTPKCVRNSLPGREGTILAEMVSLPHSELTVFQVIDQGWGTGGPGATCGPHLHLMRPTGRYQNTDIVPNDWC